MSQGKQIQEKIASINSTQKITKAMYMVAASKMKKSEQNMQVTRPYTDKMLQVIRHLSYCNAEYKHPFLQQVEGKRVAIVVISTNRGLCGSLNQNLFKKVLEKVIDLQANGQTVELFLIGAKAEAFFKNAGIEIQGTISGFDKFTSKDVDVINEMFMDRYISKDINSVLVAYNRFKNTMVQVPELTPVLPLSLLKKDEQEYVKYWDYIYEVDAKEMLDELLDKYIKAVINQFVMENNASEQSARMVAMQNATNNADELKGKLTLTFNKLRQASITQEISEIVGGAAAIT